MTDQPTTVVTTGVDLEALADRLVEALHEYVDHGPVDLEAPVGALTAAWRGSVSEAAAASVLSAVVAIPSRYWANLSSGTGDPQIAKALSMALFQPLRSALFSALHPFDGQADLLAAEAAVVELEPAVEAAQGKLEDAVDAQDLAAVMALRVESEVTIPGQLAAARTRLLELQVAAAQHQLDRAAADHERIEARAVEARQARAAAAAELERRAAAVTAVEADLANGKATRDGIQTVIDRRERALEEHRSAHEREQRDRIRQLAGLAA